MADTDIMVVAATLASGLLVAGAAKPAPQHFAAVLYFDCLDAIHAERAKRQRWKTKSLET
jgi:hypothetical protein